MTASPSALEALAKTGLPVEAQACLAALSEGEGGDLPNRLYSGGELEDPSDSDNITTDAKGRLWHGDLTNFPAWHGATTAGGLLSTAVGWLQFTRTTWNLVVAKTGNSNFLNDTFTNGWWLAQDDFRRRSGRNLMAALTAGQLELIPLYLRKTWVGGADSGFPKRYANNLALLKTSPPPPTDTLDWTIPAPAVQQLAQGGVLNISLKIAGLAAFFALMSDSSAISTVNPTEPIARAEITGLPPVQTTPPFSITLRFERGADGITHVRWERI